MTLRVLIERHRSWFAAASVAVTAICLSFAGWNGCHGNQSPGAIERLFFSDDDGRSYFAASKEKGFAFEHEGRQAYRAYVYRCESGDPFVGFLGRRAGNPYEASSGPRSRSDTTPASVEIKKPGQESWVLMSSPEGQAILKSLCPHGAPQAVLP